MDSQALTLFHVIISLLGIWSGFIVALGFLTADRMPTMTAIFLLTTVATSVTGFFFHRAHILPSHIVGIISLVLLAGAIAALYSFHLRGVWRVVYVVTAVMALYLNCFVLVAQAFLKIPTLHALAPKGSEPPFAVAQGIVLVLFVILGSFSVRRFHPEAA